MILIAKTEDDNKVSHISSTEVVARSVKAFSVQAEALSNPNHNRPKFLNQLVTAPLSNTRQ